MMSAFTVIGAILAVAGMMLVVTAIRHHGERLPQHTAMLIGGMMMSAFGIVIAGFALVYQNTAPLDLNTGAAQ
jgi:drug/metabolite transporter (DMT)-like permease